jgi:hypothetical protein
MTKYCLLGIGEPEELPGIIIAEQRRGTCDKCKHPNLSLIEHGSHLEPYGLCSKCRREHERIKDENEKSKRRKSTSIGNMSQL